MGTNLFGGEFWPRGEMPCIYRLAPGGNSGREKTGVVKRDTLGNGLGDIGGDDVACVLRT
eukprot:scaffold79520_cov46-Attheya_sp.AAC.1